jgi:hypothetical protein
MARLLHISEDKLRHRAYVHWYTKYGMELDDFVEKFYDVHQVVEAY